MVVEEAEVRFAQSFDAPRYFGKRAGMLPAEAAEHGPILTLVGCQPRSDLNRPAYPLLEV